MEVKLLCLVTINYVDADHSWNNKFTKRFFIMLTSLFLEVMHEVNVCFAGLRKHTLFRNAEAAGIIKIMTSVRNGKYFWIKIINRI